MPEEFEGRFDNGTTRLASMPLTGTLGANGPLGAIGNLAASDPGTKLARITRSQWQHFLDTYRPVEQDIIERAMATDFTAQGDEAGRTAATGVAASAGTAERNIRRSGTALTPEERSALTRRRGLASAKAVGRAENTTRRTLSDARTNLLAGIVGIGNGVSTSAMSGAQSVADLAAQREASYQQGRSQTTSNNIATAASIASLIIAM